MRHWITTGLTVLALACDGAKIRKSEAKTTTSAPTAHDVTTKKSGSEYKKTSTAIKRDVPTKPTSATESDHATSLDARFVELEDDLKIEDDAIVDEEGLARMTEFIKKNEALYAMRDIGDSDDAFTEGAEVDSKGFIVIDVLCGFSPQAVSFVGGHLWMACEHGADGVTATLRDSGITNVRLRVVAAERLISSVDLDDRWHKIVSEDYYEAKDMVEYMGRWDAPDLKIAYIYRNSSYTGVNDGMAGVGGSSSLVNIRSIGTTQHEWGHNFGLNHCPDPSYPNGNTGYTVKALDYGTALCSDAIPYFSNPKVKYNGHALGDETTSSVKWMRKSLGATSANAKATHPLDEHISQRKITHSATLTQQGYGQMSDSFAINITKDMPTVWITTNRGEITQINVNRGRPPTPSEYYTRTNTPLVMLNNAPPGVYYVALKSRRLGATGIKRAVHVWQPLEDFSTTTTPEPPVPEWDEDTVYSEPCTKVKHKGDVFLNGWYVMGTEPDPSDIYGPWRVRGSPDMFPFCL